MANKREQWAPTPEQINQIRTMAGYKLGHDRIATILGISASTLERSARVTPALHDALEKGREQSGAMLRQWAYESARKGNVAMQIFLLKTQEGFRETERLELTGADGGPIQTKKELTVEEAAALVAKYERLQSRILKKA